MRRLAALLALLLPVACSQATTKVDSGLKAGAYTGTIGQATYQVDIPAKWNGTLLLYSHGYAAPTGGNPAADAGDATTKAWLLENGSALASSPHSRTGSAPAAAGHGVCISAVTEDVHLVMTPACEVIGRCTAPPKRSVDQVVTAAVTEAGDEVTVSYVGPRPPRAAAASRGSTPV